MPETAFGDAGAGGCCGEQMGRPARARARQMGRPASEDLPGEVIWRSAVSSRGLALSRDDVEGLLPTKDLASRRARRRWRRRRRGYSRWDGSSRSRGARRQQRQRRRSRGNERRAARLATRRQRRGDERRAKACRMRRGTWCPLRGSSSPPNPTRDTLSMTLSMSTTLKRGAALLRSRGSADPAGLGSVYPRVGNPDQQFRQS